MALPPIEIIPGEGAFDYTAKYLLKIDPGDLSGPLFSPAEITAALMDQALRAHRKARCRAAAIPHTDFIVSAKRPVFLETNTCLPGLTAASLYPKALKVQGSQNLRTFCASRSRWPKNVRKDGG